MLPTEQDDPKEKDDGPVLLLLLGYAKSEENWQQSKLDWLYTDLVSAG